MNPTIPPTAEADPSVERYWQTKYSTCRLKGHSFRKHGMTLYVFCESCKVWFPLRHLNLPENE